MTFRMQTAFRPARDLAPRSFWAGRLLRLALVLAAMGGAYWYGSQQVRGPIVLPPGPKTVFDRLVGETEVVAEPDGVQQAGKTSAPQ